MNGKKKKDEKKKEEINEKDEKFDFLKKYDTEKIY